MAKRKIPIFVPILLFIIVCVVLMWGGGNMMRRSLIVADVAMTDRGIEVFNRGFKPWPKSKLYANNPFDGVSVALPPMAPQDKHEVPLKLLRDQWLAEGKDVIILEYVVIKDMDGFAQRRFDMKGTININLKPKGPEIGPKL